MEPQVHTEHVEQLRQHLRRRLQALYGERLRQTLLFGSYARGEAEKESDLDVLVVLSGPLDRYAEYRRLGDLTVELMELFGIYVAPTLVEEEAFQQGGWPLLMNVQAEGIAL